MSNINEISKSLSALPESEKKKVLATVFGADAAQWYEYKRKTSTERLVNPQTGEWVSSFKANGQTYYIRTPEQGLSLLRLTMLKKQLSAVGFNASYGEQMGSLNRMVGCVNTLTTKEPKLYDLVLEIENQRQAITNSNRNWDFSFTACTLFIVRPDEDLTTYNEQEQESKIEDWNKAGLHPEDFFLCSIKWAMQLQERSQRLLGRIKQQAEKSSWKVT